MLRDPPLTRRTALKLGAGTLALWACRSSTAPEADYADARLRARPRAPTGTLAAGVSALGLEPGRDGLIVVPDGAAPAAGWPLAMVLHGSGGNAEYWAFLHPIAQQLGIVLLLPESRFGAWDRLDYAPDCEFLDRALLRTFANLRVDPDRIALGGFSAGGSYSLTVGLANGDLFRDVFAFAPSALVLRQRHGRPPIYIAHGTQDTAVPAVESRDGTVPALRQAGYSVEYEEFAGGHVVPAELARKALERI